jgi:hypothetical protein
LIVNVYVNVNVSIQNTFKSILILHVDDELKQHTSRFMLIFMKSEKMHKKEEYCIVNEDNNFPIARAITTHINQQKEQNMQK